MRDSGTLECEAALHIASLMAAAARTAPKTRGIDNIRVVAVDDAESKERLCAKMKEIAGRDNRPSLLRDAHCVAAAPAVIAIGVASNPAGLDCGLSQPVWDELDALSIETTGERVLMLTGLGSTETAPFALAPRKEVERAGMVGIPAPGMDLKLVPNEGKLEARVRGPNITPGYWRQDDLTRDAFDEEGFYKLGDALLFVNEDKPELGFTFDGRLAEDFKLSSGTWVSVGPLRAKFIHQAAPFAKDIVVAGHDRDDVAVLIIPDMEACRGIDIDRKFREILQDLARESTGSSNRIMRAIVVTEPLSMDAHEITDKGSINQKSVLNNRAALVEDLYASPSPPHVIVL